jgi:S1-C subfamily serine protease
MIRILVLYSFVSLSAFSQQREAWMNRPASQWPTIALVNEVLYKNGDTYEDPSLREIGYAGTGFLIDTGSDTIAATAKHVLWIARNRKSNAVTINGDLEKWIMRTRNNSDAILMDKLLNEDIKEILFGESTILERDWLFFSIKGSARNIHPLKPRYTTLQPGEKVYRISNPYSSNTTVVYESKVIRTEGNDIFLETDTTRLKPGASGSPIIDKDGFLVGIMSSAFGDPKTGKDVEIAVSTSYLQDFLQGKEELSRPKKSVYEKLYTITQENGVEAALDSFNVLSGQKENYFIYNLRIANQELSRLGNKLLETGKIHDAVKVFELNVTKHEGWFEWNDLGKGYVLLNEKGKAINAYSKSIEIYKNEEAIDALKKLESSK